MEKEQRPERIANRPDRIERAKSVRKRLIDTAGTKALLTLSASAALVGSMLAISISEYRSDTAASAQDHATPQTVIPREPVFSRALVRVPTEAPPSPALPYIDLAQLPPPPTVEIVVETAPVLVPSLASPVLDAAPPVAPPSFTQQGPAAPATAAPPAQSDPALQNQPRVVLRPNQVQKPAARTRSSR